MDKFFSKVGLMFFIVSASMFSYTVHEDKSLWIPMILAGISAAVYLGYDNEK